MKFRVTLRRVHIPERYNPFLARDVMRKFPATDRVWEFEAKDEAEVRRYYEEAKAENHENVSGFDLVNIEVKE